MCGSNTDPDTQPQHYYNQSNLDCFLLPHLEHLAHLLNVVLILALLLHLLQLDLLLVRLLSLHIPQKTVNTTPLALHGIVFT